MQDPNRVKAKDRFIWEPQALCPPPIYVLITSIRKHGTQASAECWQGPKRWKRNFPVPLPTSMRRYQWTEKEVEDGQ